MDRIRFVARSREPNGEETLVTCTLGLSQSVEQLKQRYEDGLAFETWHVVPPWTGPEQEALATVYPQYCQADFVLAPAGVGSYTDLYPVDEDGLIYDEPSHRLHVLESGYVEVEWF